MLKTIVSCVLFVSSALADIVISRDTAFVGHRTDETGTVLVNQDVFLVIEQDDNVAISGNLVLNGELYIASDPSFSKGFAVTLTSFTAEVIINTLGQFIIDGGNDGSSFSQQYTVLGLSLVNHGQLLWTGNKSPQAALYDIASSALTNTGVLLFFDVSNVGTVVHLGAPGITISNDGTVCLKQLTYLQENVVTGQGCLDVGDGSVAIVGQKGQSFDEDITIFFSGDNAIFGVDVTSPQTNFNIRSFGLNNMLAAADTITEFHYNDPLLVVTSANQVLNLNIGSNYDINKFQLINVNFGLGGPGPVPGGAIRYVDVAPDISQPHNCIPCPDLPPQPNFTETIVATSTVGDFNSGAGDTGASNNGAGDPDSGKNPIGSAEDTSSAEQTSAQETSQQTSAPETSAQETSAQETSSVETSSVETSSVETSSSYVSSSYSSSQIYYNSTQYDISTTVVTITSCSDNVCSKSTSKGVTTYSNSPTDNFPGASPTDDFPSIDEVSSNAANSMKAWTIPIGLGLLWALF